MAVLQAATVGAAAATDKETAHMLRSLTLIGPTVFRGNSNSFLLNAWAYFFGVTLDTVWTSLRRRFECFCSTSVWRNLRKI